METKQTIDNIKKTFIVGFPGILKISEVSGNLWKFRVSRYSICISVLLPIFSIVFKLDPASLINEIQLQMVVFLPCILGFTIAGYALVVGFVQSNMLNKISEPAKDSNFSLYQKMSSTFAINVILQGVALIFAYLYHFIIFFDTNDKFHIQISNPVLLIVNIFGLIIITFWFTISIFLVVQIVVNIFNFSQLHHYFINTEKVRNQNPETKNEPNEV